jgi:tripartite-type tricarboxylate transporter receptor subunit TctC
MKKIFTILSVACFATTMLFANGAKETGSDGATYPNGPVSVIVPYGAGGGTDSVARALVDSSKGSFSDGIAVENRTGGGGSVGMSYGMHSKANGQIVTMVTVELVTLPHTGTGGDINYKNFEPIMMVNSAYSAITVPASSPYNSLEDLMEAAKTKNLKVGNSGIGAIWHLAATGLAQAGGVEFTHVPFAGAAPAITSLLGDHIDAVSVSYAEVASQIDAGALKCLAVLAPNRLPAIPNIPTAKEIGYDISIGTWRGLAVPVGTPKTTVDFLVNTFSTAANSDQFKKFMKNTNNDIEILDAQAFGDKLVKDNLMFKSLIESIGLAK